jgi:serine/threonine protein kinase
MPCCFGGGRSKEQKESSAAACAPAESDVCVQSACGKQVVLPGCDPVRLLGEGTFGTVVLVRERSTGTLFAAKIMSKAQLVEEAQLENIITERRVLREAGPHPFVIECHSGFQTPDAVVLVLEYLSGGDMYDLLKRNGCLSEDQARFYIAEILIGVQELHRLNFVFRDLKLENILLDERGHVRLTDFGLAGRVESGTWDDRTITDISGTAIYQAPEIFAGAGHGRVVDFWALGVLAHVILTGRPPFAADGDREELHRLVQSADVELDNNERLRGASAHARDFIRQLLQRDPSKRLGSADGADSQASIRAHPFLDGVDWDALLRFEVAPPLPPPLTPPPCLPATGGACAGEGAPSVAAVGDAAVSAADAEKRVFEKLVSSPAVQSSASSRRLFTKGGDQPGGLDTREYKVVNVPKASPHGGGRVSIGLDFRGRNQGAQTKTWTGTTDDFGRVISPINSGVGAQ